VLTPGASISGTVSQDSSSSISIDLCISSTFLLNQSLFAAQHQEQHQNYSAPRSKKMRKEIFISDLRLLCLGWGERFADRSRVPLSSHGDDDERGVEPPRKSRDADIEWGLSTWHRAEASAVKLVGTK
jgi:hypothetical protein